MESCTLEVVSWKLLVDWPEHPLELTTVIKPVDAPEGTVAVTCEDETKLNELALVLLKRTEETALNPVPEMETRVPTGPEAGLKELIFGPGMTVIVLESDREQPLPVPKV